MQIIQFTHSHTTNEGVLSPDSGVAQLDKGVKPTPPEGTEAHAMHSELCDCTCHFILK